MPRSAAVANCRQKNSPPRRGIVSPAPPSALEVRPAEARVEDRQVGHPRPLRLGQVVLPGAGGGVLLAARPPSTFPTFHGLITSNRRNALAHSASFSVRQDHGQPPISVAAYGPSALKKSMMRWASRRAEAVGVEAPDEDDRLAAVVQVAAVPRHLQLVHQPLPVADEPVVEPFLGRAGQVVADGEDPARLRRPSPGRGRGPGRSRGCRRPPGTAGRTRRRCRIAPSSRKWRSTVIGWAELNSWAGVPSGWVKPGAGYFSSAVNSDSVGPHLERQGLRVDLRRVAAPVPPALARRVAGAAEPPLIAAEDLVAQARGVDRPRRRGRLAARDAAGGQCRPGEQDGRRARRPQTSHGAHPRHVPNIATSGRSEASRFRPRHPGVPSIRRGPRAIPAG